MTLKRIEVKSPLPARLALAAVILGSASFYAYGAAAQASPDGTATQLPPDFAQAQVPPSFPDNTGDPSAQPNTAAGPADTAAPTTANNAGAAADQGAAPDASATAPAQPEQRLVPSRPMGAAAQNADAGQGGQAGGDPAMAQQADPNNPNTPPAANPVEAAAAAADQSIAVGTGGEATPVDTFDPLEQYTQRAEQAQAARGADTGTGGEALPPSNRLNMVRLEGSGFEGAAAANRVSVGIDGTIQGGKSAEELQEEIRTEAFDAAITGMFPLSPDQIEGLLKRYDTTQRAAQTPIYAAPRPEISVENISLDPGVAPPVIKTAVGNVTTINVLDATGAPWPVQDVTWAGDYEVVEPEEGGHIIRVTPMSHFARGNIVIRMLTLKTPLTMTLETGRDVVQYRVDARIPEYGPFAVAPIMQGGKSMVAGSPDLTSILDGVMPGGAIKLQVSGVDGRTTAYLLGDMTYVRTPLTLLSPAWQSSVSSADGMNVYALNSAPVLLLSDEGNFQRATLSEKEDLLDE